MSSENHTPLANHHLTNYAKIVATATKINFFEFWFFCWVTNLSYYYHLKGFEVIQKNRLVVPLRKSLSFLFLPKIEDKDSNNPAGNRLIVETGAFCNMTKQPNKQAKLQDRFMVIWSFFQWHAHKILFLSCQLVWQLDTHLIFSRVHSTL